MEYFVDNWWTATSGLMSITAAAWYYDQHRRSEAQLVGSSFPRGRADKSATKLDDYERLSIREQEEAKLVASAEFQAWFQQNSKRLQLKQEQIERGQVWVSFCLMFIAVYACLALPFASFKANGATLSTVFAKLPTTETAAACIALLSMFVAFSGRSATSKSVLIAAYLALLQITGTIKPGLGFVVLFASVAAKLCSDPIDCGWTHSTTPHRP